MCAPLPYEFKHLGPPDKLYDPYRDAGLKFYYDAEAADRKVAFFKEQLTLTKGEWKGKPFEPFPWAEDIIRAIFGWKETATGKRRYRTVFIYVPRKNAKSELVAGLADCIFFTDGEPDNELAIAAKTSKQALTLYQMSLNMMLQNEEMEDDVTAMESTKTIKAHWDNTKMHVVSADGDTSHGLSCGFVAIDELHVHPNDKVIEALETGMGARSEPLIVYLTTADLDRDSVCNDEKKYAEEVRDGLVDDPRYLPAIFECQPDEDWEDPEVWAKYNPSYPVTPSFDFLQDKWRKAKHRKSKEISFKRMYLNMRVSSVQGWLEKDLWDLGKTAFDEERLLGQTCFGALDLASKKDIAGFSLFFPDTGHTIQRYYVTKDAVEDDKVGRFAEWVEQGHMIIAGKKRMDFSKIFNDYVAMAGKYKILETAFDPWNAHQFSTDLEKKINPLTGAPFELVEFRQGFQSYNEPSKEFEVMVSEGMIKHDSPVLDWMADNVCIEIDKNENIRPVKPKRGSRLKIDGIVMIVMALGLSMVYDYELTESVYEERDMIVL